MHKVIQVQCPAETSILAPFFIGEILFSYALRNKPHRGRSRVYLNIEQ